MSVSQKLMPEKTLGCTCTLNQGISFNIYNDLLCDLALEVTPSNECMEILYSNNSETGGQVPQRGPLRIF